MRKATYFLIMITIVFSSCEKDDIVDGTPYTGTIPVDEIEVISKMTNDFGWELFLEIAADVTEENILISPLSVQTALSMAANGANGNTIEEMLNVLGCPGCMLEGLNEKTSELRQLMEEQSGSPRLISANGFFYDPAKLKVNETFSQNLTNSYRAAFQSYDFSHPVTVGLINDWVKENTDGKIEKIIDKITPNELAFIINALHFKADWANGFHPSGIYSDVFTNASQQEVSVEYLNQDYYYSFAENDNFYLVDLFFKDSTYTMSFIQPREVLSQQPNWISVMNSQMLTDMWSGLTKERIDLTLPKFEIDYETELIDPLKRMGVTDAFSPFEADFTSLGTALYGGNMYISKAKHKAILKIDENGAEGGAVTALGIAYTSAPPVIKFNKPFAIIIRHKETNTILFAGLINDPSL